MGATPASPPASFFALLVDIAALPLCHAAHCWIMPACSLVLRLWDFWGCRSTVSGDKVVLGATRLVSRWHCVP